MDIIAAAPTNLELNSVKAVLDRFHVRGIVSGIGPAMTAHVLTKYFEASTPTILLLCGLGGLYSKGPDFETEVFIAEWEIFADLGRCTMDSISPLEIEGRKIGGPFLLSDYWGGLCQPDDLIAEGFKTARIATVSCASADRERAWRIAALFNCKVENMEGASAALVCKSYNVSLFELRAISNIAGETDHLKWRINEALDSLAMKVDRFLELLYT